MPKKPTLTENQIKFANLLVYEVGRKSPAECAFESGYKTRPRQAASELRNPKIYPLVAALINELREEAKEKYGINFQSHLQEMARLREEARKAKQMSAAINAEKNRGQVAGLYIDKKEIKYGTIDSMSMEEVDAKINELEKRLSGDSAKPVIIDGNERQTSQG